MLSVFYADTPEEAGEFLEMGVDTILTNEYNLISQIVQTAKKQMNNLTSFGELSC